MLKNRQRRFFYFNTISGRAITWHGTPLYHHNGKPDLLYGRQSVPRRCFISAAFCPPIQLCRCLNFTIRCNHKLSSSKITDGGYPARAELRATAIEEVFERPANIDINVTPYCFLPFANWIITELPNRWTTVKIHLRGVDDRRTRWCYTKLCNYSSHVQYLCNVLYQMYYYIYKCYIKCHYYI